MKVIMSDEKFVLLSYLKWFLGACVLTLFAFVAVNLFKCYLMVNSEKLSGFSVLGQICGLIFMAGALGKRGYEIQTWGGKTPSEILNEKIFLFFSVLGFFISVFSLLITL